MFNKISSFHQIIKENARGTDYFVGDIHGHFLLLTEELKNIGFSPENGDRLFAVGDLINHGENSLACLNLLLDKWFFSVLGNHEEMMLLLKHDDSVMEDLLKTGGQWLLDYEQEPTKLKFLLALIYTKMSMAFTVKTRWGNIGVIHAQAPDDWHDVVSGEVDDFTALWSRHRYNNKSSTQIKNIDLVVSGHVNSTGIVVKKNQVWIDKIKQTGQLTVISAEQLFREIK